jgi:hypothetical protein
LNVHYSNVDISLNFGGNLGRISENKNKKKKKKKKHRCTRGRGVETAPPRQIKTTTC